MPERSVIATGHPLSTKAAVHALKNGGNAFDAALAGWLASCLTEPVLTSPAGGGFAMVCPVNGRPRLYDFFTQTPQSANPEGHTYPLEANFGTTRQVFHLGPGSVATPGCVAGILQIHRDHGILPLKECAEPARELSRKGLPIGPHAATLLEVVSDLYRATPASARLFTSPTKTGEMLSEGETFHNPEFADFLDALIAEGARWFYKGDIGRMISECCRQRGGHLTRQDFEDYKVIIREPLVINKQGSTIWLNPPPSMGGALIGMGLSTGMTRLSESYPFADSPSWHDWVAPIRFMSLLRSPSTSQQLSEAERETIAAAVAGNAQLLDAFDLLFPHALKQARSQGTTQLSVIDGEGNEVSMTTSNGAGSAVILEGTGFMLNNMLGEEDLQPEGMHTWKPDTRLSSMMSPALVRLKDGTRVALGSGGSNRIRSTILQILRHLVERRAGLREAVEAPRVHWENDELHAETEAIDKLSPFSSERNWPLIEHSVPNLFFGGAHSVARSPDNILEGIGDPRRGGSARVV